MMNSGIHPAQLQQELQESDEYKLMLELQGHEISLSIFDRNYQRLIQVQRFLSENPDAHQLMILRNRDQLMILLSDVIRLTHNFVASAMSLVDHTRRIYNSQYRDSNAIPEYDKTVEVLFATDPLSRFVQDLRRYCQHYKAPNIALETLIELPQSEPRYTLYLQKADLLTFSDWSAPAKKFLEPIEEKIDLIQVATEYREKVLAFHQWFGLKRREIHAEEIRRFRDKEKEVLLLILQQHVAMTEADTKRGLINRKDEMFTSFLSAHEFDELESIPRNSLERPLRAIEMVEKKGFKLPEDLKQRIIELYKHPDITTRDKEE